jgi:predicted acyltransferase
MIWWRIPLPSSPPIENKPAPPSRNFALDRFRGYAVAGMIVVNFLGGYACTPRLLRHTNDYCSYADTIMPHFLFAVGLAVAMVCGRFETTDIAQIRQLQWKLAKRCSALLLLAFLLYFPWSDRELTRKISDPNFWFTVWKRDWMQTLSHIAWTTLWMIPCVAWSWTGRWLWLIGSVSFHLYLSEIWYFHWVHAAPSGIDGGPLGFLTWSIPAWTGWWAGDVWLECNRPASNPYRMMRCWLWVAAGLMMTGYVASCGTRRYDREPPEENQADKLAASPVMGDPLPRGAKEQRALVDWLAEPPFVPPPSFSHRAWNYWMMSQKAGTLSYLLFSSGFSLAIYALFEALSGRIAWAYGLFHVMGRNAITCYAIHGFLISWVGTWLSKESAMINVALGLTAVLLTTYSLAAFLHWRRIYVRL